MATAIEPLLIVHGGAGDIPDSRVQDKFDGVRKAACEGYRILKTGGSVIDAVVGAVKVMEDLESFNAGRCVIQSGKVGIVISGFTSKLVGEWFYFLYFSDEVGEKNKESCRGSVLTLDGTVEMEAQIIEGKNLNAGCVTLLKHIEHPIELARMVMEKTPHTFLGGDAAEEFAKKMGVPMVTQEFLKTESAVKSLENFKKKGVVNPLRTEIGEVGTVGAIAIDANGHMASATSTGGICGKYRGRIGDTPILGSGGYADDNIGTVSTTGHGESIMRYNLAQRILNAINQGKTAQEAADSCTADMSARVGNDAGAIVISRKGEIGIGFSSKRMSWAYQLGTEVHYGVDKGQHLIDYLMKC